MKEKKLTKEGALQKCAAMWSWLAENPAKEKKDWPEWKENGGKLQASLDCFACEFNEQQQQGYCDDNCILPCFASLGSCVVTGSPYIRWVYNKDPESRTQNAKLIRDSAKAARAALRTE